MLHIEKKKVYTQETASLNAPEPPFSGMTTVDFSKFRDPEKAKRVWNEYLPDLKANDLLEAAMNAVKSRKCSAAIDLDLILDRFVTYASQMLQYAEASGSKQDRSIEDIDSNGWYSNARKCLED